MEVLISMGVLAVGLLGIAALIPAGRHQIAQGSRLEYASMVGRGAFREMQIRGFLNPVAADGDSAWYDGANQEMWDPSVGGIAAPFVYAGTPSNQVFVAIDPLGVYAPVGPYGAAFPYNEATRPLRRIVPFRLTANQYPVFDSIFRSSLDLITEENAINRELPPTQLFLPSNATRMRRASNGDYSWMATVVSDPTKSALGNNLLVSVAVFSKRNLSTAGAGEYIAANPDILGPGEIQLQGLPSNFSTPRQTPQPVAPGQWIMLAGEDASGNRYYRWTQVLSAAPREPGTNNQSLTVRASDWHLAPGQTNVWLFDNIVNVYEKTMPLEIGG